MRIFIDPPPDGETQTGRIVSAIRGNVKAAAVFLLSEPSPRTLSTIFGHGSLVGVSDGRSEAATHPEESVR
jgi:hypothetical protein